MTLRAAIMPLWVAGCCLVVGWSGLVLVTTPRELICEVVDGDSIRCSGQLYRIRGIDAPETAYAQTCEARLGRGDAEHEIALGDASREALRILLRNVRLEDVDYDEDRWGRPIATVWAGETLAAEWMIANGYAVAYDGELREGWCE